MSGYFILIILVLAFVLIFQISKASEYVSVLKGEEFPINFTMPWLPCMEPFWCSLY